MQDFPGYSSIGDYLAAYEIRSEYLTTHVNSTQKGALRLSSDDEKVKKELTLILSNAQALPGVTGVS